MKPIRRFTIALIMLSVVIAGAVAGYKVIGGPSVGYLQAIYMAIITLAGVGYGEIVDTSRNPALRVFNIFIVLIGVTITVYALSAVTAFLVEGEITDLFWRRKMQKKIAELKNHYIICGLGNTGRFAVQELRKTNTPFVVVDQSEEAIKRFREHEPNLYDEMLYVVGDATDEATLDQAGIEKAAGMTSALHSDKDNLVVTVMARQKNPKLRIISRCTDLKFAERIVRAGANSTVSPNQIGGLRMASELLRPHVVGFLDLMLKEKSATLRIEDIEISAASPWIGHALAKINLKGQYNLLALAVKTATDPHNPKLWVNPPDEVELKAGMVLIVMGAVKDVQRAREDAGVLKSSTAAMGRL
jgi:voltage-gated potassium channel